MPVYHKPSSKFTPGRIVLLGFLAVVSYTFYIGSFPKATSWSSNASSPQESGGRRSMEIFDPTTVRLPEGFKVAIYEANPYHLEVMGSVLYDLTEMGVTPDLYRDHIVLYGFNYIMEPFYTKPYIDTKDDISPLLNKLEEGYYDLLVLTTCENSYQRLLPALTKNPYTRVACMLHHGIREPEFKGLKMLSQAGSLTVMGLNDQCTRFARVEMNRLSEEQRDTSYDKIRSVTLVPTFPLPTLNIDIGPRKGRVSRIAVQGSIDRERRSYTRFLKELLVHVDRDPKFWGLYKRQSDDSYLPIDGVTDALSIHFMGQIVEGSVPEIPAEFAHILTIHSGLPFSEYYELMNSMDLLVPLLRTNGYYMDTASSSMAAGLISRTPVLTHARHALSYTYLEPPAGVFHPTSMSEATAIMMLRNGEDPMATTPQHKLYSQYSVNYKAPTWEQLEDKFHYQNRLAWQVIAGLDMDRNREDAIDYPDIF